jgi:hypothetical protein
LAQSLQSSQEQLASAGSQGDQSGEMQGQDSFSQSGQAKSGQGGGKGQPGGKPGAGTGAGGWGGFRPPAGAPTPSKKLDTMVKGVKGKGTELVTPFRGAPDRSNSKTPYYAVSPTALRQAEDALTKEDVPAAYRKSVKRYFEGIGNQ